MKACPGLIRPPCFPRTPHLPRSKVKNLQGPKLPRQRETQRKQNSLRHFSMIFHSVPASPHPSITSPDPAISPTLSVYSETNPDVFLSFQVPPANSEHTLIKQEDISHRDVTLTGTISPQIEHEDCAEPEVKAVAPMTMTPGTPSSPVTPLTPLTPRTPDSLSDLSRPPSSQFSYSTNLNTSISNSPSVKQIDDSDEEYVDGEDLNSEDLTACSSPLSDLCFSSLDGAVFASCSPPTSTLSKSLRRSLSQELQYTKNLSNLKETPINQVEDPVVKRTPNPNQSTDVDGAPSPCPANLESQSILASASPLDVLSEWKTCRWPILPPITPRRGSHGSRASLSSPISCSQSDMFARLDAAAPRSVSCQSLDHADCSNIDSTSVTTDLSPGLAALTVGCDSGELGSLSRVQLLLLERGASESLEPPPDEEWNSLIEERGDYEPGLQVWSLGIPQHYQCTVTPYSEGSDLIADNLHLSAQSMEPQVTEETSPKEACPGKRDRPATGACRGPNQIRDRRRRHHRKMLGKKGEERKSKALQIYTKLRDGNKPTEPSKPRTCSRFEDSASSCHYRAPEQGPIAVQMYECDKNVDTDSDGYLSCFQVLLALKDIIPPELLTEEEEIYVYRILELVDFSVTEGLTDLRLFAVVASLAEKIAMLDDFMRSLISKMDFKSLEMKLYKAKKLFLFLLEGQSEGTESPQGCISAEQLLVELKAGGIREEHEEEVRRELRSLRSLDLLDFLAHLPLFILIHNSVIANPLDDSSNL
ncbi:hypothetical protein C0J50_22598 [Silurus asotus]|uniref:Uncharacterized protein n=1 Tax=Silurus asotus TaxID=30991 RepID=A0AAD5ALM9_SILAS|nr:hypothetical protein C0J50_22598 [Silurus asotus]